MKTIALPEDVHKDLVNLKLEEGEKNTAEIIKRLVIEFKRKRFEEASKLFRIKLRNSGIDFAELLKRSRKMKEVITNEWYPDKGSN
mgnify:FL=1